MTEARSVLQIWEARVCMAEDNGFKGFPSSLYKEKEPQLKVEIEVYNIGIKHTLDFDISYFSNFYFISNFGRK